MYSSIHGFAHPLLPTPASHVYRYNPRTKCKPRAELNGEDDLVLRFAINAASIRFQETNRPEPLFVDPYAECLIHRNDQMDLQKSRLHYCLATKFIDDKLLQTVNCMDGLKQVVLLTDGMDTRPYRLQWPSSTIIFDISPEKVFKTALEKLSGVGAKIPKSCLFLHISLESANILQDLLAKGFNGNRPSIWAVQGLAIMNSVSFEQVLSLVSSLAMKGSLFLGELPAWLADTNIGIESSMEKWMDKVFMRNGFQVNPISYNEVASSLGKELARGGYKNVLFVAEQLRFSDDQMETWRRELQRIEDYGDEEGFEEL